MLVSSAKIVLMYHKVHLISWRISSMEMHYYYLNKQLHNKLYELVRVLSKKTSQDSSHCTDKIK